MRSPPSRPAAAAIPPWHPAKLAGCGVNHEYDRGGALAYLAAYDVHQATVFGQCAPSTGIEPFMALVEHVMTQQPYASAKRVFWIVDNGSSHRGKAAIDRLAQRFPTAVMVHTPAHASWLNQVEIYFSLTQRKIVYLNDFTTSTRSNNGSLTSNSATTPPPTPSNGKFTPIDLDDLLGRIDQHQQQTTPNTLPQAA